METRHIKIDYEDALNSKKHLLGFEINLLHVLKKIRSYRIARKKEFLLKNKLKLKLMSLRKSMSSIQSFLPAENIGLKVKIKKKKEVEAKEDIHGELEEIKRKLDKLGGGNG